MAITVNFEQLQQQAQQNQAAMDEQLKGIGIVRIGGQYYQTQTPIQQAQAGLNLQSSAQGLATGNQKDVQTLLDNYSKELGKSFTPDQLSKAASLAAQGENDLSKILQTVGQPTQATADEQKNTYNQNYANISSALSALDTAQQQLVNAGGAKGPEGFLAKIPFLGQYFNPKGYVYEKTKSDIAAQLTRAVTGAARTSGSIFENFMSSLPDVTDTPQVASQKLKNIYQQITGRASSLGFSDITSQYSDYAPAPKGGKSSQPSSQSSSTGGWSITGVK